MTKWDKWLIVFVVIVSLFGIFLVRNSTFNVGTKYIVIEVNGDEYKRISFGPNMIGKTIDINTEFGYNKIEIGDEKVRIIEADCPDKLDVKQGWISSPRETIVCLPNKLVVMIVAENEDEAEYDYLSH